MKRILIVEDNPADLYLIREALKTAGLEECDVDVAIDGPQALSALNTSFDFVVLDLNLPRGASLEFARALKADPVKRGIPIVAWSSAIFGKQASELEALGLHCMAKPCRLRDYEEFGKHVFEALNPERTREAGLGE